MGRVGPRRGDAMTADPARNRMMMAVLALSLATPAAHAAAPPRLKEAFAAAYPDPIRRVKTGDAQADRMRFSPALLTPLGPGRYALVSKGQNLDNTCHGCSGAYSMAYLKAAGARFALEAPPFTEADSNGGFGAPPRLDILPGFGAPPVLRIRGSHEGMGAIERWQSLVRLGPDARAVKGGASRANRAPAALR